MDTIQRLRQLLHQLWLEYWLLRWVIGTVIGWQLGVLLAVFVLWLFGAWGVLLVGALIGVGVGTGQAWILFAGIDNSQQERMRWILLSALGGLCGTFPAGVLALTGIFNLWIAALLVGGCFAALVGGLQVIYLLRWLDMRAYLWIGVCALGGMLSAGVTLLLSGWGVPLWLSPGSVLFGVVTGVVMLRWHK